MRSVKQYMAYLLLRVAICIMQAVSMETCHAAAKLLAPLCANFLRRKKTVENLERALPALSPAERDRLIVRMWENLILMLCETAHAPRKIHPTNWRKYVSVPDSRRFIRAMLEDRPTLVVSAHFGNFEMGGYVMGLFGFPTYSIARTFENPYIDRFVNGFRRKTGQYILPKKGGYDQILQVLSHGGALALLADQYAGSKGCWVNFFGRQASAHKAIALFSLGNDARIFIGYARRLNRPMRFEFAMRSDLDPRTLPPAMLGVREITQWFTTEIEQFVRETPDQYWWLHDRWKDRRSKDKAVRQANAA